MSDSFADLWNSSSLQKKPQTISSLAQQQGQQGQGQRRPQGGQDLFALLSSPTARPSSSSSRLLSSSALAPPSQPQQRKQQRKSPTDAFSDLFSSPVSTIQSNLTIAQRTALADQQRKDKITAHEKQQEKENLAWAGLDSLSLSADNSVSSTSKGPKSSSASVSKAKGLVDDVDDWSLKNLARPTTATDMRSANGLDTWNLDSLPEQPTKPAFVTDSKSTKLSSVGSFWDLNEFTPSSSSTANTQLQTPTHTDSQYFDLGNLADGASSGQNRDGEGQGDDDDFMSVFNKPLQPKQTSRQHPSSSSPSPPPLRMQNQNRTASPPPHVLGQVVEMGFSIPKAKAALAANNNDAQAAVNQLLASEGDHASNSGRGTPIRQVDSTAPARALSPRSRGDRERELPQQQQRRGEIFSPSPMTSTSDIQAQAEQLLAQASVFSRGMFNKASSFLKEKKELAQKAVEEYRTSAAGSGGSNSGRTGTGRPKWMQPDEGNGTDVNVALPKDPFSDDVDTDKRDREPEVWIPKRPDRQQEKERQRAREREATATVAMESPPKEEPEIDLFAPNTSKTSFSSTSPRQSFSSTERSRQQSQGMTYKYQRNTSAISSSIATLKSEANASFKLGQFGNAETLYTRAIDSLCSSSYGKDHLYFVLLLNNRANARMKTGDVSGTIRDCDGVVGLITTNCLIIDDDLKTPGTSSNQDKVNWNPSEDVHHAKFVVSITDAGRVHVQEEVVDLVDGLTKAIKRRAEAYEGLEKWNKAKEDWGLLRGCKWVRNENVRSEAGRGVGRCVRMTGGSDNVTNGVSFSSASTSTARPPQPHRSRPITSTTVDQPSPALSAFRSSAAAAEAEDRAKHKLKDAVDARLSSWKQGKEGNIRALLASLDMVLWEEMVKSDRKAVKVGMHELVMPAQVKMKYMKAVARVHPDKLNPSNSTLEQRMIAQGVFGVLSEAWNAFKL